MTEIILWSDCGHFFCGLDHFYSDEITLKVATVADISLFGGKITFVVAEIIIIIIKGHVVTNSVAKVN